MTSSKEIGLCPAEATLTIREGTDLCKSGNSRWVSKNGAR
jgi:hypothetical protein